MQQQPAQRHAALLATGKVGDLGLPWRQAQRVGGDVELILQRVRIARCQDRLQTLLLLGQCVEIGAFFGIGGVDRLQCGLCLQHLAHAFLDRFADGLVGIQLRFLRQVADLGAGLWPCLALEIGIYAGHDLQHGRLAGAVEAK